MSPGPSLAMIVRHSLGGSRLHGVICAWAHAMGIGIYALVTLLGLAVVLQQAPTVFQAITLTGALYLAWIGFQALRAKGGMQQKLAAGEKTSLWVAARDGFAISIFNPKIMLFFLALFSQFVGSADSFVGKGLIVTTPLVIDGLWYTVIAVMLSHPNVLNRLREKASLIDTLSGIVLIALALRVVVTL
ncbi:amino acid efflux permease RhtB family protein [Shewanella gelidii]|uniref:Amino acid efflux permease RhtB family protein n=2 Tax=Shewanella gelidii TaxID=1642821 RepID=A0A917N8D3_9GAMM|nr:amino acid efflux permease RhtB family protein [Shewanella gelidii]